MLVAGPRDLHLASLVEENGTALVLPVRVHLKNPLLGNSCYIGSEASPIELHLTTGTTGPSAPNSPISGKTGQISEEEEVVVISNNSLVDNSFSVPTSEGCGEFLGITGFLDGIVNGKLGLPSTRPTGYGRGGATILTRATWGVRFTSALTR
jgi:hypothetical protein